MCRVSLARPTRRSVAGNIANLIGNTKISYPASGCHLDVITNGFTLTLDSGDGNAFACTGSISGSGNVEFFMGPSYTGFKDAPLHLGGDKPNTTTGKFFVKKGRVQLEKPKGVDAISGDVIVGGQGFNDCLFWKQSDQLKDSVNITLLDAGNNGAAYLDLNGCSETAASLTMTVHNKIKTDGPRRQRHADREIADHRRREKAGRRVHRGHRTLDRRQGQGDCATRVRRKRIRPSRSRCPFAASFSLP